MNMETKVCKKCGRELPLDKFHKKSSSVDGHQDICKECKTQINKKVYSEAKAYRNNINTSLSAYTPRELMEELKRR